jgi:hypothetical protein
MAGVVVVPERAHFEKIDGDRIAEIFSEVSMRSETVNDLIDELCSLPDTEEFGW